MTTQTPDSFRSREAMLKTSVPIPLADSVAIHSMSVPARKP